MALKIDAKFKLKDAKKALLLAPELLRLEIEKKLRLIGVKNVGQMKAASPRFTGKLANSHAFVVNKKKSRLLIFNRAKHAIFLHEGTKHGKAPPVEALERWAGRVLGDRKLAFVVARAIKQKGGLKARKWMQRVWDSNRSSTRASLQRAIDGVVGKLNRG